MTAKEMFEKLGYERIVYIDDFIDYVKLTPNDEPIYIVFEMYNKEFTTRKYKKEYIGFEASLISEFITEEELAAINKQMEELSVIHN